MEIDVEKCMNAAQKRAVNAAIGEYVREELIARSRLVVADEVKKWMDKNKDKISKDIGNLCEKEFKKVARELTNRAVRTLRDYY